MNKLFIYAGILAVTGGAAGTATYFVAPTKTVPVDETLITTETSHEQNTVVQNSDDEDETPFVPTQLTPRDYFINNLTTSKYIEASGNLSLIYGDYSVALDNISIVVTLETLTDVNVLLTSNLSFNNVVTPLSVTYVDETIYLSALNQNLKFETKYINSVVNMLSSLGVSIELPNELQNINIDSLQEMLGGMSEEEIETGYKFVMNLFDDFAVNFYSDKEYKLVGLGVDASIMGIDLNLNANIQTSLEIVDNIKNPEITSTTKYQDFANLIPFVSNIGKLINQTQFAATLDCSIQKLDVDYVATLTGKTQFDLNTKSGLGKLVVKEDAPDGEFIHNVNIDVSTEDIVFSYSDDLYQIAKGRVSVSSIESLINLLTQTTGALDHEFTFDMSNITQLLEGTVLATVLEGRYEALLDGVIKEFVLEENFIKIQIDKSFLNTDEDFIISIGNGTNSLDYVKIANLKFGNRLITLKAALDEYDPEYTTDIDRSDLSSYSEVSDLIPLVNGIKKIIDTRQFGFEINGSLKSEGETTGVTFNATTHFDLENEAGSGEITFVENESKYSKKPVHNIKIDVDKENMLFNYNDNTHGKLTIKTLNDMIEVVKTLIKDGDPRLYEWFGEQIEGIENGLLMRIINGEYELALHHLLKSLSIKDNLVDLVVGGKLFDIDSDIHVQVGYNNDGLTFARIIDLCFLEKTINLQINNIGYDEKYSVINKEDTSIKYYDFSDIKILLDLGLNVSKLDYFHITGTYDATMTVGSMSLDNLANLSNLPLDIKVFENNGSIEIHGSIKNIPTVGIINGIDSRDDKCKWLEFFYYQDNIYLVKHDYTRKYIIVAIGDYYEVSESRKMTVDEFFDNAIECLIGWGMGLSKSTLIWNAINDAIEEHAERTEDINYSKLLKDYSFTDNNGQHSWYFDLNIADLANNDQLTALNATIYSKEYTFDGETKEYLSHLDAHFRVDASIFHMPMYVHADLVDIDPSIKYYDFLTNETTKDAYSYLINYVTTH